MANIEALKIRPVPNGHLAWFMNMLQHSGVKDELQFQGIKLTGSLDGKPKRGDVRTGSFQSKVNEAIGLCLTGHEERFAGLCYCFTESSFHSCMYIASNELQKTFCLKVKFCALL